MHWPGKLTANDYGSKMDNAVWKYKISPNSLFHMSPPLKNTYLSVRKTVWSRAAAMAMHTSFCKPKTILGVWNIRKYQLTEAILKPQPQVQWFTKRSKFCSCSTYQRMDKIFSCKYHIIDWMWLSKYHNAKDTNSRSI